MKIPGPLSFRLMIFSMTSFVATVAVAPLLDTFAALLALGGFFLAVAALTCGIYELKNQPSEKLRSTLSVSISGTVVAMVTIFMFFVFSKMDFNEPPKDADPSSRASKYF